ncbi:MAG: glycosyltransferase [Candidatus Saccharicenans sp.]|nr:glycosyltransferase [Candidatus Saccharicenans sp.]
MHLLPAFEPAWAVGGTTTAHSNLCSELASLGHRVTVYTTRCDGLGGQLKVPVGQPVNLRDIEVWYFPFELGRRRAFYSRSLLAKLKETVKTFDLVHLAGLWQYLCYAASDVCLESGVPYIITPHSSLMVASFHGVGATPAKKIYWKLWGRKVIRNAPAVHFLSQKEREDSRTFCFSSPSFIVPNGIYVDRYERDEKLRAEVRTRFNIPDGALVILFLGRVHPKKNLDLVIRALPALRRQRPDVFLMIVGPVDQMNYVQKLRTLAGQLNLSSCLVWTGLVDHWQTPAFYSAADLMVMPSLVEGVSLALTEAMAASLPVIISKNVANCYEIAQDRAGLVIEPSAREVERALLKICLDPEPYSAMAERARAAAQKRYDIRLVARLMIRAYQDVLSGERSPELSWQ